MTPTTWAKSTLGEVAEIVSGATPKTSVDDYWDGDIPWVTPKDLSTLDGMFIDATPRTLSESGLRSCSASLLPANSVLLSSRAPIGLLAINTKPMATNQGFKSLIPDKSRVDARFLYRWLEHNRLRIQAMGTGATFKEINKKTTSSIEIMLPPLEEQKRIAGILDAADQLRNKRQQYAEKLDALTQAIFIDTFGNPASALSQFGFCYLSELGEMANGHNFTADDRGSGDSGILMLDVKNMYTPDTGPDLDSAYRIQGEVPKSKQLKAGDLVFVRSSVKREGVAWPAHFSGHNEPVAFCGFLIRLRFPTDTEQMFIPEFLVHYLRQPAVRMQAIASAGQVAITNVNQKRLGQLQIPKVPLTTQHRFRDQISEISSVREIAEASLPNFDNLFSSLQQRAFRGDL